MIVATQMPSTSYTTQLKNKNVSKPSTITPFNNHTSLSSQTMNYNDNIKGLKATLDELNPKLIKTEEIECSSLKTVQQQFLSHLIAKVQGKISSLEQKEN